MSWFDDEFGDLPELDPLEDRPCPCGRPGCIQFLRNGEVVGGIGPVGCPL